MIITASEMKAPIQVNREGASFFDLLLGFGDFFLILKLSL